MRTIARKGSERRAFTLIETLVVLAVLGILFALLLPAVQAARESARAARCGNHLRQLGLGLNSYISTFGVLPRGSNGLWFSPHSMLLPYLEQGPLFDAINFQLDSGDLSSFDSPFRANWTATATAIDVFLCPSDALNNDPNIVGQTNYAGNAGDLAHLRGQDGVFLLGAGILGISGIADGTSNTAAMAEWSIWHGGASGGRSNRTIFEGLAPSAGGDDLDRFAAACHSLDPRDAKVAAGSKGFYWIQGRLSSTLYNHVLSTNDHSCSSRGNVPGTWTAGSGHSGGAHTLFADGHTAFLKDSMSLDVWRAIGSRSGGEPVSGDSL